MAGRQESASVTRRKIVAAAKYLIEARGINNISIQDITEKADVAKGSFYTYFKRKEDILAEITYKNFDDIKDKYLNDRQEGFIYGYLTEFVAAIYDGGLELCKSWTANEAQGAGVCKFEVDKKNLTEILSAAGVGRAEEKAHGVLSYIYGIIAVWCMTDGKYDLMDCFKKNFEIINKILEA